MTTAFVLGNGVSRQNIDLKLLKQKGKIYGCNALYREFTPDVLVATDRPIATAIQESGYALVNKFYTRKPLENTGALGVPGPYHGYSSGPIAVALAAQDGHQYVYLLGFDMGPNKNQKINNLYAGTEFYKSPESPPTFTGNWLKQICKIINDHPNTVFTRIAGLTTARIPTLEGLVNLHHEDLVRFQDRINTKTDL
jgi:hypothetical protein